MPSAMIQTHSDLLMLMSQLSVHSDSVCVRARVCVHMYVCMCAHACACVRVSVRVYVCVCMCVRIRVAQPLVSSAEETPPTVQLHTALKLAPIRHRHLSCLYLLGSVTCAMTPAPFAFS
jgi:hypothetical protein